MFLISPSTTLHISFVGAKLVPLATKASNVSKASNICFLHLPMKSIFVKYPFFLHSFVSLLVFLVNYLLRFILLNGLDQDNKCNRKELFLNFIIPYKV